MILSHNRYKTCAVRFETVTGPGQLLTVDSGAKKAGVALWFWEDRPEAAYLVEASTVKVGADWELPGAVYSWFQWETRRTRVHVLDPPPPPRRTSYYVVEKPKKRPNKRRYHADLQRLLDFIQACRGYWTWTLQLYPEEWKAGVGSTLKSRGKEPHHRRLRVALTEAEQALFDRSGPDGKDAVGIGLFVLGRTGRGGKRCPGS